MRTYLFIIYFLVLLTAFSCKPRTDAKAVSGKGDTSGKDSLEAKDPSRLTVIIHPQYVVAGNDTLYSPDNSARYPYIAEKINKLDSLRKIKLRVPFPPDTAVVMPVVRILKPSGAEILITPYKVD